MQHSQPDTFRHVHRVAQDEDGNSFLVVIVTNRKAGECSIRVWSIDGQTEPLHRYFPMREQTEYFPLRTFLAENGLTVASEDEEIPSTKWKELSNLRRMSVVKETTKHTETGWVSSITYRQPWFGWEFTVVTPVRDSKQIAIDSAPKVFDKYFKSCSRLLIDVEAVKASKGLEW